MTINQDTVTGKWMRIKGEVQKAWGKLTPDEIDQTKGQVDSIERLIEKKYGKDKDGFNTKFSAIVNRFEQDKDDAFENENQSSRNKQYQASSSKQYNEKEH